MHDGMKATKLSIYKTLERLLNIIRFQKEEEKKKERRNAKTARKEEKQRLQPCNTF